MIDTALSTIRDDLSRLREQMRAKGHASATLSFNFDDGYLRIDLRSGSIAHDGEAAFAKGHGRYSPYEFCAGTSYAEVLSQATNAVEKMSLSVALACEAWFQPVAA